MKPRVAEWNGPKHVEHDGLLALFDRTGQVWEDDDGWIYFVVGSPQVAIFEDDGKPFQYEHKVFVIADDWSIVDNWPLFETNDRPLETVGIIKRLA